MATFRVMMEGRPLFLLDVEKQQVDRLGFFTTRWVRAETPEAAGRTACSVVQDELAVTGNRNPPDQPLKVTISQVVRVSWIDGVRHRDGGRGFTFFPDGSN
jgi:hypothetical protein